MCLGIDEKTIETANWASMNQKFLLKVVLTGAKYRFTAVGDKRIILNQPYFKEVVKSLK